MIKADKWIAGIGAVDTDDRAVAGGQIREVDGHRDRAYGTSSYDRYAARANSRLHQHQPTIVDPKAFDAGSSSICRRRCIIQLARSRVPSKLPHPAHVLTICLKCGCALRHHRQRDALEPEWRASTLGSRTRRRYREIYANEGVEQVIFFESDEVCETSYRMRRKVQGQRGSHCRRFECGQLRFAVVSRSDVSSVRPSAVRRQLRHAVDALTFNADNSQQRLA